MAEMNLIDARLKPLALALRHFVKLAGLGNSKEGGLNTYSCFLLAVMAMQSTHPQVLPTLHRYPETNTKYNM